MKLGSETMAKAPYWGVSEEGTSQCDARLGCHLGLRGGGEARGTSPEGARFPFSHCPGLRQSPTTLPSTPQKERGNAAL